MILKLLGLLGILLVILVIVVSTRPADFRYSRSLTISARPAVIFAQVNELKKWEAWSPWAKTDPNMKTIYSGPAAGVGASQHWTGNNQVGEGNMTIVESQPNEKIGIKLEFLKPFAATNDAVFTFTPQGNQTTVTWTMSGKNAFIAKAFALFVDCDKMIGKDFEKGLSSLKTIAESAPNP